MIMVMNTTPISGASSGTVTRRKVCHSLAPSTRAASSVSRGMAARPAAITTIAKPAQIQMNEPITAGVINDGPSQPRPPHGGRKVDDEIRSR